MSLYRHVPVCLLSLVCVLPLSACGDSTTDEDSGQGAGGSAAGQGGTDSGGSAGQGGADNGGSAGQNAASACDGVTPELLEISPSELNSMLETKDFELINVHTPDAGEIPGTDVHIRHTDTTALETHLGNDLSAKAVLYCLTGPMSAIAGRALVGLGYCQIYDMPAAMVGWEAEGYTLTPAED